MSSKKLLHLLATERDLLVHELINKSEIMTSFPVDEMSYLVSSVTYLKNELPEKLLTKLEGVI